MDRLHRAVSGWLRTAGVSREQPILAAVSGGADSMALLRALVSIGQRVRVAHVHHGVRGGEADAACAAVAGAARALGVGFDAVRIAVPRGRPGSWEARARVARYAALEDVRARRSCRWIATGHTLDDQAETVLMRAARGTRLEGLAGIEGASRSRHLLRPLLEQRRAALRGYLAARGASWCEDSSNADPGQLRGQLRLAVLPQLERLQPSAVRHLAQLATQARELREERRESLGIWLSRASEPGDGGRWIDARAWQGLGEGARREALAVLLRQVCPPQRLARTHLERALVFLARARPGQRLSLPGDCTLLADREAFWIGPADGPHWPAPFEEPLEPGRDVWLPDRRLRLRWQRAAPRGEGRAGSDVLWLDEACAALCLRSARVGDCLHRGPRRVSLKSAMRAARFSVRERGSAAVVADGRRVLWVVGLPRACALGSAAHEAAWELVAERVSGAGANC